MKAIIMSAVLLTAVANTAFAVNERPESNRNYDLRDSPTYCGPYTSNSGGTCANIYEEMNRLEIPRHLSNAKRRDPVCNTYVTTREWERIDEKNGSRC
jgi:hypothetical protein